MINRVLMVLACAVFLSAMAVSLNAQNPPRQGGWNVPATAKDEKNPLTVNAAVLAGGKRLYEQKCQRCHGKTGKGDGPDAEVEHKEDMDLTAPGRAARNPDGVVFYKIWNGRPNPKMPPLSEEATKEQVWAIVAYSQTLRGK